ncbi:DoxX family protein [Suttonella ornithocola]|uniref:DoxX n=1 Tax=Suttonella ornithocola TaxID=279832 RepID=A0A380MR66_9GAMM|nr:DoxX family protein [Suttonella ornithocola]SUO94403.1 DoxX [Suttonella ornithocola]
MTKVDKKLELFNFIPLLAIRFYLAPIFIVAGWQKWQNFESTAQWFGNVDWGLGLPFPELLLWLTIAAEFLGGILLLLGLFTRLTSIPLIITMIVAALTVHWQHGWFAIAPSNPSTSTAQFFAWLNIPGAAESLENSVAVGERLQMAKNLLQTYGHYDWLTETGSYVILNNGIEFATTYLIMLTVLLIYGAGRYFSLDYWISRLFLKSR